MAEIPQSRVELIENRLKELENRMDAYDALKAKIVKLIKNIFQNVLTGIPKLW